MMTNHLGIGERIAWYRRRRGMSQEVLAGLVGRTADWLQKIERNRLELDRLSVIKALVLALDVCLGDLLADPTVSATKAHSRRFHVSRLSAALTNYQNIAQRHAITQVPSVENLRAQVCAVWDSYQSSRYSVAAEWLPSLMDGTLVSVDHYSGSTRREAFALRALTYHAAAAVLTKIGERDLGWIAAERGLTAAREADRPIVTISLLRSVAHTLLANNRVDAAIQLVDEAAIDIRRMRQQTPELISVFGTLLLTGAVSASCQGDRSTTRRFLEEAERMAVVLKHDANHMWTAFGPTNVAIHRTTASIALNDIQVAVEVGSRIDTSGLPLERRVRHSLDLAHAWTLSGRHEEAVAALLDSERTAPEQVRNHFLSRRLVLLWIRTHRGRPNSGLAGLAKRMELMSEL